MVRRRCDGGVERLRANNACRIEVVCVRREKWGQSTNNSVDGL